MVLFETLEEAKNEAKFMLYNSESVGVYDIHGQESITGKSLFLCVNSKKLIATPTFL